ncbi:MAG: sodium:solute symporter family protein [Planctomycetales bacterium]|nr:sodium:solute symporter family protein [Planctomycetales bacterium]
MLGFAVAGYLAVTVAIGLFASSRVHGAKDFMVAGRSLPLFMNFTCVFATWFGAETVLSVSATFAKDGFLGHPGDPFGAGCCLILVALFFAKAFYRLDLLTIGDFYKKRFGKTVEVFTSVAITLSYVGWASAQLTALGLVLFVLGENAGIEWITLDRSILIGAAIVVVYTIFGGMWSVALTDMIQTVVIVVGLLIIAGLMARLVPGGALEVVQHAHENNKFNLLPTDGVRGWFTLLAGFLTVALGSIPQQDVFQRVTSAKDEKTAVLGTLLGGSFYFFFAFVPIFIAYSAVVIEPEFAELFSTADEREVQRILPDMILGYTPFWAQAMFLGALLSAILSTASGTLLAPSSLFVENVLRPLVPHFEEKRMLLMLRITLLCFAVAATWQAVTSNATMYELVLGAYSVTLVTALVPLAMGIYWKRATTQGAMCSIAFGMAVWLLILKLYGEEALIPPQLCGLAASFVGMLVGALLPQYVPDHQRSVSSD